VRTQPIRRAVGSAQPHSITTQTRASTEWRENALGMTGLDHKQPGLLRGSAVVFVLLAALASACSSSPRSTRRAPATTTIVTSSATSTTTPSKPGAASTQPVASRGVCGNSGPPPKHYASVVVFAFENRTWNGVGLGFGPEMPYLHGLGQRCSYFADWTETDTAQNSLTQYVGQVSGASQPGTVNDCSPSKSCSTTADNLFRQARRAGLVAVNYVEGAKSGCSANGNAAKHIPDLYLWGADDRAHCNEQVRSFNEFDANHLPAFAFVTPTLCNDGHDCSNKVVDAWANTHVQPVLDSVAYRAGKVAVFIWYDEDHPVPNLWIAPTAQPGAITTPGAGYAGTLRAWESMLGLPCLANACTAPNMRAAAHS
jgi:phosphatidylinositol-3-phosphatase